MRMTHQYWAPVSLQWRFLCWSVQLITHLGWAGLGHFPGHTSASRQCTTNPFKRPPMRSSSCEMFLFYKLLICQRVSFFYSRTFPYRHLMCFAPSNKLWSSWNQTTTRNPPECHPISQPIPGQGGNLFSQLALWIKVLCFRLQDSGEQDLNSEKYKWFPARVSFPGRQMKQSHLGCDWRGVRNILPPLSSKIPPSDTFSLKVLIFVKIQIDLISYLWLE